MQGYPEDGIAVVYAGSSDDQGWVVIEDDFGDQEVFNQDYPGPGGCPYGCTATMYVTFDLQPANYGRIDDQVRPLEYVCCGIDQYQNGDDLVTSGVYEGYNTSWYLGYGSTQQEALDHNHFWIIKKEL